MKSIGARCILLWAIVASSQANTEGDVSTSLTGCPTDSSIDAACLEASIPPAPMCYTKSASEWVAHAQDSSTRCCGDDISECGCPVKNGAAFQAKIVPKCSAIAEHCTSVPTTPQQEEGNEEHEGHFSCPTDSNISETCLNKILPPWPICLSKTAQQWVDYARNEGSLHCCGDDKSSCGCPVKDKEPFLSSIGDYCAAVEDGGDCFPQGQVTTASSGHLRGNFDMEKQIQREEYSSP